jgi:hypothetical protein
MKRLVAAGLASLFALTAAGEVSAGGPTPASGAVWNPNQRVTFRWKEGDEPPAWMRAAINAAADDSNDSRDSRAAVLSQSDTAASSIAYTGDMPTNWAVGYTVTNIPNSFTMRLRPQGYPLDWGNLRWCQFYDSPPTGCYDAEMIALHEFGHVQTLDHPDDADVDQWTDTVMHWAPKTKAKAGWNQHQFGPCDVARLQIRYEPQITSTAISTCLDLATNVSLSTSTSSAVSGGTVSLTARLKIADDAMWPLLASEPLAARQLILQRRVPGASTWSGIGSMTVLDDNGRYSRTLTPSNTYDYRVVFNGPSDEGLEGSTSLVVRVTVSSGGGECGFTRPVPGAHGQFYTC